jgi:hypothetical protein
MVRHARLRPSPAAIATAMLFMGVIAGLCLALASVIPAGASAAASGPVAAYSFDEGTGTTVEDVTGDGHTATIEGAKWARGRYGDGLEFKGSEHDVVKVPASSELNFEEEFTLEAWVRPASSTDKNAPIVGKTTGGGSGSKSLSYYLYAGDSESKPYGEIQHVLGTGKKATASSAPPGATWTHLALTYDGAVERLFVNGVQVAETATEAPVTTTGELQIGAETEHSEYFSGRIDEVRIYDRDLDAGEVGDDMEVPLEIAKQRPVAAYSFDEGTGTTVEDLTGDGHTATIEGAKWARGRYGDGLEFKGSEHDVVKVPASSELNFEEEFTLEAWVRPSSSTDKLAPIVGKTTGGGSGSKSLSYYLYAGNSESRPYGEVQHILGTGKKATASTAPPGATWTHLALTYDGGTERLYVDGVLVSETATEAPVTTTGELQIGAETEHSEYFSGRIDEVRIYDRALGAGEVDSDMEAPLITPKATPVAAYSFDEGTGTTVEDVTGHGHTATIEGAKWARGRYGDGLEFKGSEHNVVKIPASSELNFEEEFTLEAWVRPASSTDKLAPILGKTTGGGSGSKSLSYYLYAGNSESKPYGEIQHVLGTGKKATAASAPAGATWTHLALTFDGAKERLYVNGVQVAETTAEAPVTTSGELQIGAETEHSEWFSGRIDEVRIYNRVLNGVEVGSDMEAPLITPKAGPVAAYSFDEGTGTTVEDLTGDGHTATIEGAEWTDGRYGGALNFESGTACVSVPDSPELRLSEEFTVEAWVRPGGGLYEDPILVRESGGGPAFGLGIGDQVEGEAEGFIGTGKGSTTAVSGEELRAHDWTHLAATYDGSRLRLYEEGELVAEKSATTPPAVGEGALKIGCDTPDGPFTGKIDEVRVYNRALDGAEVAYDREAPIQTPKATPVAAYSFDEGEGTTVEDVTGDGHTATIEGAKWTTHGRYGGGMEFEAAKKDVLKIPASPELDLGEEFTLEAWVRPSGASNKEAPLIDKQEGGGLGYFLYEGGSVSDRPVGAAGEGQEYVDADDPLPADAWSHVALVFDGDRTYIYVDGEQVESREAATTITSEGELEIGGSTDTSDWFDGRIDEVRVYNRALAEAELKPDVTAPIPPADIEATFEEEEGSTNVTWTPASDPTFADGSPGSGVAGYFYRYKIGEGSWSAKESTPYSSLELPTAPEGTHVAISVWAYDNAGNIGSPKADRVISEPSTLGEEAFGEPDLGEPLPHEEESSIVPEPSVHEAVFTPGPLPSEGAEPAAVLPPNERLCPEGESPCGAYNRPGAEHYAEIWTKQGDGYSEATIEHNHKFPFYSREGGDCTNFASQVLWGGGMRFIGTEGDDHPVSVGDDYEDNHFGDWFSGVYEPLGGHGLGLKYNTTENWPRAEGMYEHLLQNHLARELKEGEAWRWKPGDLIFFELHHKSEPGVIDHVQVVESVTPKHILIVQHSENYRVTLYNDIHQNLEGHTPHHEYGKRGVGWNWFILEPVHTKFNRPVE